MGTCWSREENSTVDEDFMPQPDPRLVAMAAGDFRVRGFRVMETVNVDQLVLDTLSMITSFIDNEETAPVALVKLHVVADKDEGWNKVVMSLINVIPIENPLGPSAITIVFDDCPLPSKTSVINLSQLLMLSKERALNMDIQKDRNICVILGCIAEKLAGPYSVAMLNDGTIEYLLEFVKNSSESCVVLFALIALEKFAHTTENKVSISKKLDKEEENPLVPLSRLADDERFDWRQIGFCATWMLDNLFVIEGRMLSYQTVDMSNINAILNSQDASEYLKLSSNGLEARCDSYSFESVRCTFEINEGCWYYECKIITSGVMQIGWATKSSHFMNQDGYGIGDDLYSLSYDGCRRLIWHKARATPVGILPMWQPGDILGCLIDLERKEAIFALNGQRLPPYTELFTASKRGFFAGASFMGFQQCKFNFGDQPFRFPPTERRFQTFNAHGTLTAEEKQIVPRRLILEELRNTTTPEDACIVCCDARESCCLVPCGHSGFCSRCPNILSDCPLCREPILNVRFDE